MSEPFLLNTLLVPIDFSPPSRSALHWAVQVATGDDAAIIVVHVIDQSILSLLVSHGFGERELLANRLRHDAEQSLLALKETVQKPIKIDTLVCEGTPFVEIIQKASDFAVDAVIMSKVGAHLPFESLLFGSTAEKVARGCRHPVLILPTHHHP